MLADGSMLDTKGILLLARGDRRKGQSRSGLADVTCTQITWALVKMQSDPE